MINPVIREDSDFVAKALGSTLPKLAGTTLLVTGAAGFLCGYIVDMLAELSERYLERPVRIVAVDNYLRGAPERLLHLTQSHNVRVETFDVRQPFEPGESVDFIIHGASVASPIFYRKYPLETIEVNVFGLKYMLDLARRGARSAIYFSSSEIYGDPDAASIPTAESYRGLVSCTGPRACYDESKRLGETLCVAYHQQYGVPVKAVRPFNVYGPGQRLDDQRIIPDLLSAVLERRPIVLFSDGRATRSFCYAADFTVGMLKVMVEGANGEAYNVGNDEEITIDAAAQIAAQLAETPLCIEKHMSSDQEYLTDNPQRRCPDLTKIRRLGFEPRFGLMDGLKRTLRSYLSEV